MPIGPCRRECDFSHSSPAAPDFCPRGGPNSKTVPGRLEIARGPSRIARRGQGAWNLSIELRRRLRQDFHRSRDFLVAGAGAIIACFSRPPGLLPRWRCICFFISARPPEFCPRGGAHRRGWGAWNFSILGRAIFFSGVAAVLWNRACEQKPAKRLRARAPERLAPPRTEMHMHLARSRPGPGHSMRLCISWLQLGGPRYVPLYL